MRARVFKSILPMVILVFTGCAGAGVSGGPGDPARKVAEAYGLSGFDRIEALRYTFNVQIGDRTISRSWVWEPKTHRIVYRAGDAGAEYERNRDDLSEELRSVDAKFINDQYWLFFPLHLAWDAGIRLVDTGIQDLPIGPGEGRRLVVSYPDDVGYTPGDVYELFVGEDYRIKEWIYRKGGAPDPTRMTTWEAHKNLGPLTVSLNRRDKGGGFRVWFTDVSIRLRGENRWIGAK